jgi:hypothetical protein
LYICSVGRKFWHPIINETILMRTAIIFFSSLLIISCASQEEKRHAQTDSEVVSKTTSNDTLRQLILTNAHQINAICDSIILANTADDKNQNGKSIWMSTTTVFTQYAPNILGEIAAKASDSTECIVVEVTVYNEGNSYNAKNQKNSIMISAKDSICSKKLNNVNLKMDSTERFIFGVNKNII